MTSSIKVLKEEPVKLEIDLAGKEPFPTELSRAQRQAIREVISSYKERLGQLADMATDRQGKSPLEHAYEEVSKKGRFITLEGTKLSWKLRIRPDSQLKTRKDFASTLYVLLRLSIVQDIVKNLKDIGLSVSIAEALAIYRAEGDFSVPLSLSEINYGLVPDHPLVSEFPLLELFLGPHHTFFVEKKLPPHFLYSAFVEGIQSNIESRETMLEKGASSLVWLQSGKEAAMTLFLLLLGGLDFYTAGIREPGAGQLQRLIFTYNYAQNRAKLGLPTQFSYLRTEGESLYYQICGVDEPSFTSGELWSNSLISVINDQGSKLSHHFLPVSSVDFVTTILTEAMVRQECMRRAPLVCGGKGFDPPLPPSVAYIRYNGWDIYFLIIVLDLLNKIVRQSKYHTDIPSEREPLRRIEQELKKFKKEKEVWTVYDKWITSKEEDYFLKMPNIRKRIAFRGVLQTDAMNEHDDIIGPSEKLFRDELNSKGSMDSALPLIDFITQRGGLWEDFEKAMVSHIGPNGSPWIGHSPTIKLGNEIGINALRFYYLSCGYSRAFGGS